MAKKTNSRRLTAAEKKQIAAADPSLTNTALSEKMGVSLPTIARWRGDKPTTRQVTTRTTKKHGSATPTISVQGDYVVITLKIPKAQFQKDLFSTLF